MVLSRRERVVLIAALAVLGLLAGDRFVVEPLLKWRWAVDARRAALAQRLVRDEGVLRRRRELMPLWEAMQASLKPSAAAAESQIMHVVRDAADASGLELSLLKPEQLTDKGKLPRIAVQASLSGPMKSVTDFLYRLQTAPAPLRLTELQLAVPKEGVDELTVQVRLTTLSLGQPPQAPPAPPQTAAASAVEDQT
jgi:Tfp pilus assembly protein PilO